MPQRAFLASALLILLVSLVITTTIAQERFPDSGASDPSQKVTPRTFVGPKTPREPWVGLSPLQRRDWDKPKRPIRGKVVDPNGALLSGVAVWDWQDRHRGITNERGEFAFDAYASEASPNSVYLSPVLEGYEFVGSYPLEKQPAAQTHCVLQGARYQVDSTTNQLSETLCMRPLDGREVTVAVTGAKGTQGVSGTTAKQGTKVTIVLHRVSQFSRQGRGIASTHPPAPRYLETRVGKTLTVKLEQGEGLASVTVQGEGVALAAPAGVTSRSKHLELKVCEHESVEHSGVFRDIRDDSPIANLTLMFMDDATRTRAYTTTDAGGQFSVHSAEGNLQEPAMLVPTNIYWTTDTSNMIETGRITLADKTTNVGNGSHYKRTQIERRLRPLVSFRGTITGDFVDVVRAAVPERYSVRHAPKKRILMALNQRRIQSPNLSVEGGSIVVDGQLMPWGQKSFVFNTIDRKEVRRTYRVDIPEETWTLSHVYEGVKLRAELLSTNPSDSTKPSKQSARGQAGGGVASKKHATGTIDRTPTWKPTGKRTPRKPWQGRRPSLHPRWDEPMREVWGRVLLGSGKPAAGAAVYDWQDSHRGITDSNGFYRFEAYHSDESGVNVYLAPRFPGYALISSRGGTRSGYATGIRNGVWVNVDAKTGKAPDIVMSKLPTLGLKVSIEAGADNENDVNAVAAMQGQRVQLSTVPWMSYSGSSHNGWYREFVDPVFVEGKVGQTITVNTLQRYQGLTMRLFGQNLAQTEHFRLIENTEVYRLQAKQAETLEFSGEFRDIRDDQPLAGIVLEVGDDGVEGRSQSSIAMTDKRGAFKVHALSGPLTSPAALELREVYWTTWTGNMINTGLEAVADATIEESDDAITEERARTGSYRTKYRRDKILRRLRPLVTMKAEIELVGFESDEIQSISGHLPEQFSPRRKLSRPSYREVTSLHSSDFTITKDSIALHAQMLPWGAMEINLVCILKDESKRYFTVNVPEETWTLAHAYEEVELKAIEFKADD